MKVHRNTHDKGYTIVTNKLLSDKRLSLKAKGLMILILGLPPTWSLSISGLSSLTRENETAIRSALNELSNCGYCTRKRIMPGQSSSGRIEYDYEFFEDGDGQVRSNTAAIPKTQPAVSQTPPLDEPDYTTILHQFNSICKDLTPISELSDAQKASVRSLIASGINMDALFHKVHDTDYLSGRIPNKPWRATFDWLIAPGNAQNVLNGKYDRWISKPAVPSYTKCFGEATTLNGNYLAEKLQATYEEMFRMD